MRISDWSSDVCSSDLFLPDENAVRLSNGDIAHYEFLIVCTGIQPDFDKIAGLPETLGKTGVCSNYSPGYAEYTWRCIQGLKSGDMAVFTHTPLPFNCPGARKSGRQGRREAVGAYLGGRWILNKK